MLGFRFAARFAAGCACLALAHAAQAQVVQLPSFNVTGVGTTVTVPDGGEAFLGGIYRSSEGSSTRGVPFVPFKNRAIGRSSSASTMSMRVTIIDHAAMDAALLAEAAARRAEKPYGPYRVDPLVAAEASYLSSHVARTVGAEASTPSPTQALGARTASSGPHAAASIHASAAQQSVGAASLADRLFRSEVELGKGDRQNGP